MVGHRLENGCNIIIATVLYSGSTDTFTFSLTSQLVVNN